MSEKKAKVVKPEVQAKFGPSLLVFLLVTAVILVGILVLGLDAHIPIVIAAMIVAVYGIILHVPFKDLEHAMIKTISESVPVLLLICIVGMLIGSWMSAGTVPVIIYVGLELLRPSIFLPFVAVMCAILSTMTGSSWTTCSTIGVAFMGISVGLGISKAMWEINTFKTPGSMIYGNTTDFGGNFPSNYSALASFTMADIIGQRKWPTGCAVTGIPVTEAIRVPSVQEIIDAHMSMKTTMEKAEYYAKYIDFDLIEEQANTLVVAGNTFFERVINALDDLGVDINHPGQVMAMLKAIGAEQLEINFGAGKKDANAMRGRVPVWPTNIIAKINDAGDELVSNVKGLEKKPLQGVNVVMASTDIHVFGKEVIKRLLREAGANIYDLDQSVPTQEVIDTAVETESKVLCISTHNGMAYGYAKELSDKLKEAGLDDVLVIMGGLLNEALPGKNLPEDVSGLVAELGFNVDNNAEDIVNVIAKHAGKEA